MEKKIVTIDVGSEIEYETLGSRVVTLINLSTDQIKYDEGKESLHHIINLKMWNVVRAINGIPVSEIEEVRIAGYNDKVTLKIGDVFYNSLNRYSVSENELYRILDFKNGRITRNKSLDICIDKMEDYYYVNGKRYHRDDIIIPDFNDTNVVEMINQTVEPDNTNDMVNHPPHYTKFPIELKDWNFAVIDTIQDKHWAAYFKTVSEYLHRAHLKNGVEDLEKAVFWLNEAIDKVKQNKMEVK